MMILERLKEFESMSRAESAEKNPPVLSATKVAQTISNLPDIMKRDSDIREYQARCLRAESKENSKFIVNNGLWFAGKRVANFYYELEEVSLLVEKDISNIKGYSISVKVHVFSRQEESTHKFSYVSKEALETLEFVNRVPFAVAEENVSKSDFKQILYWYANHLLGEYTGKITYITRANGWLAYKGCMVYVDGEKAIGLQEASVKSSCGIIIRDYFGTGTLWEQFQRMRQVLKEQGQMDTLLLYVLMSYSYTLFKKCGKTVKHTLFIVGARGTRKTAVALCFSQLDEKETPKFNFLATESGIQAHLQDYQDSCMLLDDLAPSVNTTKRVAAEQKLEMILRLMGDGGNRVINTYFSPAAKDLKYEACGGMIITGEYFYTAGVESSIARAVVLELNKDTVDLQGLSYFQTNPQILESLIARYLQFISKNWEMLQSILIRITTQIRSKYQNMFSNGRYADYLGQYMAQTELLLEVFKITENISEYDINRMRCEVENNLVHLLEQNDRKMKRRAPIYTLLTSILNLIEEGRCFVWGMSVPKDGVIVLETEEAYYVKQKDLADIVKMYCAKTGEPFVKMTSYELGKLLSQEDICTIYHEGQEKRLAKKYSQYGNQRFMELNKRKIKDKLGIQNAQI